MARKLTEAGAIPEFLPSLSRDNALKEIQTLIPITGNSKLDEGSISIKTFKINFETMHSTHQAEAQKNKLKINFHHYPSRFGKVIIAHSTLGICWIDFYTESLSVAESNLKSQFPDSDFNNAETKMQHVALDLINGKADLDTPLSIHLTGTEFQVIVWKILTQIPIGQLTSYGKIAQLINQPAASRAVGTAIGRNKIGYLIPCHRVVTSSGKLGGFRWGLKKKAQMLHTEL